MLTAVPGGPLTSLVDHSVVLDFADEQSIVQTRFPTTAMTLLRTGLGDDPAPAIADCEAALALPLPVDPSEYEHFVFLGTGWTVGLAHEAALKMRESAQAWAESYPAMDYRHGPIAVAGPRSLVWMLGTPPPGLVEQVASTGAHVRPARSTRWRSWSRCSARDRGRRGSRARSRPSARPHALGGAGTMSGRRLFARVAPLLLAASVVGGVPAQASTPARASAHRLFVSTTGHAGAAGTRQDPLASVNEAVSRLSDGGVVLLRGGTYSQRVGLRGVHRITVRAFHHERVILDGRSLTPPRDRSAMVTVVNSVRVTVRGLDIRGYDTTSKGAVPIGIYVHGASSHVSLVGNHVHSMGNYNGTLGSFDINAHGIAVYGDRAHHPITRRPDRPQRGRPPRPRSERVGGRQRQREPLADHAQPDPRQQQHRDRRDRLRADPERCGEVHPGQPGSQRRHRRQRHPQHHLPRQPRLLRGRRLVRLRRRHLHRRRHRHPRRAQPASSATTSGSRSPPRTPAAAPTTSWSRTTSSRGAGTSGSPPAATATATATVGESRRDAPSTTVSCTTPCTRTTSSPTGHRRSWCSTTSTAP